MDQQNPNDPNSGIGTGTHGDTGTGGTSSGAGYASGGTGTGMSSGGGMTTGSGAGTSGGLGADVGTGGSINRTGGAPIGVTAGSDADRFGSGANVATEGGITGGGFASGTEGSGGFTGETGTHGATDTPDQFCTHCGHALSESKGLEQFLGRLGISGDMFGNLRNVDIDEYLNTARDYLKGGTTKVTTYTKENPAKVAAGVAALALGAGLIYAAVNREKGEVTTTATTGFDPNPNPNLNADVNFTRGTVGYDAAGDVSVNRTGDLNRGAHGDLGRDAGGTTGYDPNRT